MKSDKDSSNLTISALPELLTGLFARAGRPLLPEAAGPLGLFVRYLRRKPGRGLAVIYQVDEARRRKTSAAATNPDRSVSLTLDETALAGSQIRFSATEAQQASLEVEPAGSLHMKSLGLAVQAFPADGGLPALAASCDTRRGGPLFDALESAARQQLGNAAWRLVAARAEPVRYKPGNRCVIRYYVVLAWAPGPVVQQSLTLFGKLYAAPQQARRVQTLQHQLYAEQQQDGDGLPILPRPLGLVDALGLTLQETAHPAEDGAPDAPTATLLSGTRVFQPKILRGRGGEVSQIIIPEEGLARTAKALARLHQSAVILGEQSVRDGVKEAKRARERAALIAGYHPAQAEEVKQLAEQLATRLETLRPDAYRLAHGGFKSSQLLIAPQQVIIVDFDGLCLADPALDVGYFLAYLRPSGLWHRRPGMRKWFEAAAAVFLRAYRQAMGERGVDMATIDGIVERSACYEAALLFKIATRRVHRLNSPRPHELAAILHEIATCLTV